MSKDTIYIDVDDDITSIISKVKESSSKVVALVPPKRIGILQSAVNLRLISRAARQNGKHLVLISNNPALVNLASAARIPTAKNLQSKPQLPPASATDVEEDIDTINGIDLPIGDLAKTAEVANISEELSPVVDLAIKDNIAEESGASRGSARSSRGKKYKVPNFNSFRKRFTIIAAAMVLLVGFFVWATIFAPKATIVITARTLESSGNPKVTLGTNVSTDEKTSTIHATKVEIKKDASIEFEATGEKEIGDKAKGQVTFQNCKSSRSVTVAAGTGVSAMGKTYITQSAVVVPGADGDIGICVSSGKSEPVAVVAQDIGEEFDADKGTRFNVAGHDNTSSFAYFRAVATTDIAGGSRKTIKVVSEDDISRASNKMIEQNSDGIKKQLISEFDSGVIAVESSLKSDKGNVISAPSAGEEAANGKATLTGTVTFSMIGVSRTEVSKFLKAFFDNQLKESKGQRVYDDGAGKASFTNVQSSEGDNYSATVVATAKLGPKIDDKAIKEQSKGKRYGEIQSSIERVPGVENVDVKFSPFWVSTVPKDTNKIKIEFKLNESK